jgi:hypothetical protein
MKIYKWTCPSCHQSYQSGDRDFVLKIKRIHLDFCGKPQVYENKGDRQYPPKKVTEIEIIP